MLNENCPNIKMIFIWKLHKRVLNKCWIDALNKAKYTLDEFHMETVQILDGGEMDDFWMKAEWMQD